MAKARHGDLVSLVARKGEGTLIDVTSHIVPSANGTTVASFSVSLNDAPVPSRRYAADICSVIYTNLRVRLLFAQQRLGSGALRSLVIIRMNPQATRNFLDSMTNAGEGKLPLQELAENLGMSAETLANFTEEPDQTIEMAANMVSAAVSGPDACLDFYDASPFAVANIKGTNKLAVEPVVRIDLAASWLLAIMKRLREVQSEFPKEPILEVGNARL